MYASKDLIDQSMCINSVYDIYSENGNLFYFVLGVAFILTFSFLTAAGRSSDNPAP